MLFYREVDNIIKEKAKTALTSVPERNIQVELYRVLQNDKYPYQKK
jgi:hypothetical protein